MRSRELKDHRSAAKQLDVVPEFRPGKKGKNLPRPLNGFGGARVSSTDMLQVSADHIAFMCWRDGEILSDRSFYGYLFCKLADGSLSPIFEFHWHPSHKGFHCKLPCNTDANYTGRFLPGAPELRLKTDHSLDPKNPIGLQKLIMKFCNLCGISLPVTDPTSQSFSW
jgi:hypothetical protein